MSCSCFEIFGNKNLGIDDCSAERALGALPLRTVVDSVVPVADAKDFLLFFPGTPV